MILSCRWILLKELFNLLPAAGFGFSKVGLGKVGVVESLGKAGAALVDDLGKICNSERREE